MAADMKSADKAQKKASKNRSNFMTISEAKESVEGIETGPFDFPFYDYNDGSTWANYQHPFCTFMEQCGYHSIQIIHKPTGVLACGSYVTEKQDQKQLAAAPYYIYQAGLDGSVITDKESEEVNYVENEMNSLLEFVTKSQSESSMRTFTTCFFENNKWKKVRNQERNGEIGGVSVMRGKKRTSLNSAGWSSRVESGHMCWQQYGDDGTPFGEATWDPQVDIEAGMDAVVTMDSEFFYNAMGPHTAYYTDATWDQHNKEILGRKVKVLEVLENRHIARCSTVIFDGGEDKTVEWHVPGECLAKEPQGDTLLLLGEVGQFLYTAQMGLFPTATHNPRSKNPNPIFSEWVSLMNTLCEAGDDSGSHNCEREDVENLKAEISGWMASNADWTYES